MRAFSFILFSALILAACAGPAAESTSFTPPGTPGGRLCVSQCSQAHNYCREDCSMQQRRCSSKVQAQALMDYEKYMSRKFLHADAIDLRMRDFERMEPCDDAFKSCARICEPPYQNCYENCGGSVDTTTSCRFLCF